MINGIINTIKYFRSSKAFLSVSFPLLIVFLLYYSFHLIKKDNENSEMRNNQN